jgi:hypothetical protein
MKRMVGAERMCAERGAIRATPEALAAERCRT